MFGIYDKVSKAIYSSESIVMDNLADKQGEVGE